MYMYCKKWMSFTHSYFVEGKCNSFAYLSGKNTKVLATKWSSTCTGMKVLSLHPNCEQGWLKKPQFSLSNTTQNYTQHTRKAKHLQFHHQACMSPQDLLGGWHPSTEANDQQLLSLDSLEWWFAGNSGRLSEECNAKKRNTNTNGSMSK